MEKTIYTVIISNNIGDIIKVSSWSNENDAKKALNKVYEDTINDFKEFSDGDDFDIVEDLTTELSEKYYQITYNDNCEFGIIEENTLTSQD